ncbi:MAG TPA: SLC13 family permease [Acidimicrobiales bacterium]|nr:SLC13 family permease [Acidimicrobiales bacterium]
MTVLDVVALLVGVAGAVARPFRLPPWAIAAACVAVVLAVGGATAHAAGTALEPLRDPIAFLLAAVPLAVLLDRLGWFAAVAGLLARRGAGGGGLWVLAALVTTVLNLDASVVLLTPLYVSIAKGRAEPPMVLAVQPVLLACLASSALPVSNLTNLIATSATGASTGEFLAALGLPSLAATVVGWVAYRRWAAAQAPGSPAPVAGTPRPPALADASPDAPADRRAIVAGSLVVLGVLVGFTLGHDVGLQPWEVALAADLVLVALVRQLPWRVVPVSTALVAATLGVLASAASAHLPVARLISGATTLDQLRATGAAALAANVANNLPALLVALPALGAHTSPSLWSVLVGVNMGPVLLATGSLASLLWLDSLGRLGVPARPRDFTAVGVRVGLPALVAGAAVHLGLHAVGVG